MRHFGEMLLPDLPTMQTYTLWLAVVASLLCLVSVILGLYSALTGKDHWPTQMSRLRRRVPASDEGRRRHGVSMMLNGGALLLVLFGVSMNALGAGDHSLGEPLNTLGLCSP